MLKKQVFFIIIVTVVLSWALNLLFGRQLVAKISTLPILNRWHILSPEAPIVITNRETVRVSGGVDLAAVADSVKSKISAVVLVNNNLVQVVGTALNLTSDGIFVTGVASFAPGAQGAYYIVLNDGRSAKISSQTLDPATSLVFFKTDLTGAAVVSFGSSKNLKPGDILVLTSASLKTFTDKAASAVVTSEQLDAQGQIFQAGLPRRSFSINIPAGLSSGEGVFNPAFENLGIFNGKEIISSDVLKQSLSLYLSSNQKISRPSYGFSYLQTSILEKTLSSQPEGALIKIVAPNSPAQKAGLLVGDTIILVNNQSLDGDVTLEEILQNYSASDFLSINVARGKTIINLKLTTAELK